jgi:steroid delta-isomerase-like uncharacterized protein
MERLTAEDKTLVRQYLEQIVTKGDLLRAEEFLSPKLVFTSPYTPEPIYGLEGFKQMIAMLHTAFPDLQITEEQMIAEDHTVAARWVASGTHLGNFMNLPPSGRRFEITGMSFYRVEDGRIVEGWVNDDNLGMLRQLGAIP